MPRTNKRTERLRIRSITFRSFKALRSFSLSVDALNILVGPNNAGKSTIISALRLLALAISKASSRAPEMVPGPAGPTRGWRVNPTDLDFSLENVHTDLSDDDSSIHFRLSDGSALLIFFPKEGGCCLICRDCDQLPLTAAAFKSRFPLSISPIPILGPVERDEALVTVETVRRGLTSHRASRHFRSYWHYFPEGFDDFAALLSQTWPDMSISRPEKTDPFRNEIHMFCREGNQSRELYWAGFGFQVWCQILTHVARASHSSLLVLDEPEIYLHPDLQRQLVAILRRMDCDVLLATHSTEIITEAEPSEVVLIEKRQQRARRLKAVARVQDALDALGSRQNVLLTQLARTRRIVFVEGDDAKPLRQLARALGYSEMANASELTFVPIGGFSNWNQISAMQNAFERALGDRISYAVVLDRDYRCDEEIEIIKGNMSAKTRICHVHSRKEIENYLLIPDVLNRAANKRLRERNAVSVGPVDLGPLLREVTETFKDDVTAQLVAWKHRFLQSRGVDASTVMKDVLQQFRREWADMNFRVTVAPGKTILRELNNRLQQIHHISITAAMLCDAMKPEEIPNDLSGFLGQLETMRVAAPGSSTTGRPR